LNCERAIEENKTTVMAPAPHIVSAIGASCKVYRQLPTDADADGLDHKDNQSINQLGFV